MLETPILCKSQSTLDEMKCVKNQFECCEDMKVSNLTDAPSLVKCTHEDRCVPIDSA